MSKSRGKAPPAAPPAAAPPDDTPSAASFAELQALANEPPSRDRALRAWRVVVRAVANPDFAVVLDFALENELAAPLAPGSATLPDGQAVANTSWINPVDKSEMIWIPAGPFYVGEDNERAQSKGFSLARHPLTNASSSASSTGRATSRRRATRTTGNSSATGRAARCRAGCKSTRSCGCRFSTRWRTAAGRG